MPCHAVPYHTIPYHAIPFRLHLSRYPIHPSRPIRTDAFSISPTSTLPIAISPILSPQTKKRQSRELIAPI
ncbi:hypothetical protein EYC84_001117 [Monilinia fructicola]|uniref:Uncharacterized protein n=1 Tax=Monilinia fructicola TaxID=38448 RepID=A0A5M9JNC2_MONFR|nr:hypothetical protein EYC84_001117 [Monilinia fructicola]